MTDMEHPSLRLVLQNIANSAESMSYAGGSITSTMSTELARTVEKDLRTLLEELAALRSYAERCREMLESTQWDSEEDCQECLGFKCHEPNCALRALIEEGAALLQEKTP